MSAATLCKWAWLVTDAATAGDKQNQFMSEKQEFYTLLQVWMLILQAKGYSL